MADALTYRQAGVDIDAGNQLVDRIKKIVPLTHRKGVLGTIGGFGGCFELPLHQYKQPVLVASTDGVGTKLRLAIDCNQHDTIGIDLVAMCVNDLVVMGAEPLFFLDYYATGQLDVEVGEKIIRGIATGCQMANVALIGGETAEMPGMYAQKDYDLAGFCVGIVEKDRMKEGQSIQPGDKLIGLSSSGPHANGFSLIRHIIQERDIPLSQSFEGKPLFEHLLTPTRIYVKSLLALAQANFLKGAAHITGGGFIDNLPRILPDNVSAYVETNSWQLPPLFSWLQTQGNLSPLELYRTFNCGVGMVVCVAPENVSATLQCLEKAGESAWVIGEVQALSNHRSQVIFSDENH